MLEDILIQKTDAIRAELAKKKQEHDIYEQNKLNEVNTINSLFEEYRQEYQNTIKRFQAEGEDVDNLVSTIKFKLIPYLDVLLNFIEKNNIYPVPNRRYYYDDSKIEFKYMHSEVFPTQLYDTGVTREELDFDIEKMITDWSKTLKTDDYSRLPSYEEKVEKIQQIIKSLSDKHVSRKFGVQWGINDGREVRRAFRSDFDADEKGVSVYGVEICVTYPGVVTLNGDTLDIGELDRDEYISEMLSLSFLEKPASLGFVKRDEIQRKLSEKETNAFIADFDPLLKAAWVRLKDYAENTNYGSEKDEKLKLESWFEENLNKFQSEQAIKFLELSRIYGFENQLRKLLNHQPIEKYFPVMDMFYPNEDHLKTSIESFIKGTQEAFDRISYLIKSDNIDRQHLDLISGQLMKIGRLMSELHKRKKVTVEQFCLVFKAFQNSARTNERFLFANDQDISQLFIEWIEHADDLEEIDLITNTWKVVQTDIPGRILRRMLIQTGDEVKLLWIKNALICLGGSDALMAIMVSERVKEDSLA